MDKLFLFSPQELHEFISFWEEKKNLYEGNAMKCFEGFCHKWYEMVYKEGSLQVEGAPRLGEADMGELSMRLKFREMMKQEDLVIGARFAIHHRLVSTTLTEDKLLLLKCPGTKYEGKNIGEVLQEPNGFNYLHFIVHKSVMKLDDMTRQVIEDVLTSHAPADWLTLSCPGKQAKGKSYRTLLEKDRMYDLVYFMYQNFDLIPELREALTEWFGKPENEYVWKRLQDGERAKKRKLEEEGKTAFEKL